VQWDGWRRYAIVGAGVVVVLAVFAVCYGWLPWWIDGARLRALSAKDQAGVLSSDRGDVLKMVAGAGAIVALIYTARKHALDRKAHDLDRQAQELSRQVFALSEQGQVTDRYTKAITQLSSDKESERIGGIYALERIMADSERDHPTVVEVLAAFVRQRAPLPPAGASQGAAAHGTAGEEPGEPQRPAADVQAAMTVLARRPQRDEPFLLDLRRCGLTGLELPPQARLQLANLEGADLSGAHLYEATLTGAILSGAALDGASLSGVALDETDLGGATLTGAYLSGAALDGALLGGATLTGAYLNEATLTGAYLSGATFTGAYLGGATLTGVKFLEASQLADAVVVASTELDEALAQDAWVLARIDACKGWTSGDPVPAPTPKPPKASGH
jgi:hypothetical protein